MSTTYTMPDTRFDTGSFSFWQVCSSPRSYLFTFATVRIPVHTFFHTTPKCGTVKVAQNLRRIHRDVIVYISAH